MDERRLIEIETKLAHQEHLLAQLDDAVTSQQAQVTELERLCRTLVKKLNSLSDGLPEGSPADERPPHY